MSRLAKKPIIIPEGVTASFEAGNLVVKGPNGTLSLVVKPLISFKIEANEISISIARNTKQAKSLVGTYASHTKNMLKGVKEKYVKKLILEGVGYKSEVSGTNLKLALGFSHPVIVSIPADLTVSAEKNIITIQGASKELVGQFAAKIRSLKKPEPYKGKGFRYDDEIIRRKQGKKSVYD